MADPKKPNRAGSTALIALIAGSRLFVANVGDSRGIMCDSEGKAVPLSVDHKPFQKSERLRVEAAGGTVKFAGGAWRVNGHVSVSRMLGNRLADKKSRHLIADPDILTFELCHHKPRFLVLASDGLWDVLSNEEVVDFLAPRLQEEYLGARSLAYYAYLRGSGDNITVVVIDLRNRKWRCSRRSPRRGSWSPRRSASSDRGSRNRDGKTSSNREYP
nr:PREDICTED: protein phosphatase 1L-like [Bemisia tabaci]